MTESADDRTTAEQDRWAALCAAQAAAQGHGIVLTVATVEQVLKIMKGETLDFDPDTSERAVQSAYDEATGGA